MANIESKLSKALNEKLKRDKRTAHAAIEAIDSNGVVTLIGTVACYKACAAAALIVFEHPGVQSVINDIQVDDPEATTELEVIWPQRLDITYPN
jgi:osmotically-inducible protein OsmY